jgi:hypothetical protein
MRFQTHFSRSLFLGTLLLLSTAVVAAIGVEIDDSVPNANPRVGSPANRIIDDYRLARIAQGTDPLENPSGPITTFGFLTDGTKTEPDENLYLEFERNPGGPTPGYNYGRRFLFQGHENGGGRAYVTRINLDIHDPAHRITLLTPANAETGLTGFGSIDGSTWDPFSRTLLFTQESASTKGVIEITPGWPATVRTLETVIGQGGFEGIHPDDCGDLLIIEDASGASVNVDGNPANTDSPKTAKQPNSFVYKFHPYDRTNLLGGGTLYALQVWMNGAPLTFHAGDPVGDTFSTAQLNLHTPGTSYAAMWVRVHDNVTDGSAAFNANTRAKAAGATPFKRPENAQFQPGSDFETFYFCPTGDTDVTAAGVPALAQRGAWGSIFRVHFERGNPVGRIAIVVLGDAAHAAFDNLAFADRCTLLATEDRGDTLHEQLNTLDSVWAFRVCGDEDRRRPWGPRRLIALGRDSLATAAVAAGGDGDNEPTGLYVSDGDPSIRELLGRKLETSETRWFVTQQHGKNRVFEILPNERRDRER